MAEAFEFITNCLKQRIEKTEASNKSLSFRIKPSKNWQKLLNKHLCIEVNNTYTTPPQTYHELLTHLEKRKWCKESFICIVRKIGEETRIASIITTCIDFKDLDKAKEICPLFIEVGNSSTNYAIKQAGKIVTKNFWKPVQKASFVLAKEVKLVNFVCES